MQTKYCWAAFLSDPCLVCPVTKHRNEDIHPFSNPLLLTRNGLVVVLATKRTRTTSLRGLGLGQIWRMVAISSKKRRLVWSRRGYHVDVSHRESASYEGVDDVNTWRACVQRQSEPRWRRAAESLLKRRPMIYFRTFTPRYRQVELLEFNWSFSW